MARETYLLDSSALLTLVEDEDGADRVEEILRSHPVLLPWLSLLELRYITLQERGVSEADRRYALATRLTGSILWEANEAVLLWAARFKAAHRLSLADAVIAAHARVAGAILLHKDPEFDALAGELALEALPYKKR